MVEVRALRGGGLLSVPFDVSGSKNYLKEKMEKVYKTMSDQESQLYVLLNF
jgi:hypothetical protein